MRSHNDMPLACSPLFTATSFGGPGVGATITSRYFYLDNNAQVVDTQDTVDLPRTGGSALKVEPETETILVVEMSSLPLDVPGEMWITRMDLDLNPLNVYRAQVLPDGYNGHWPQGILRIGDYYMVAYIGWPDDTWDGHNGDMWVAVFDMDWNLLETQQVSNNDPSNPGMRPGLVRRGDIVLATYDKNTMPHIHELRIDLETFGIEDGDSGNLWDTGDSSEDAEEGCGCSTQANPRSAWLGLAALFGLLVRRRYSDSSS
jgi:MYXO-CTERM domain-containing protein